MTSNGMSNKKPEDTAAEGATTDAEGIGASDESGCSSVLGAAAVIMTAVAAAVVLKKKE